MLNALKTDVVCVVQKKKKDLKRHQKILTHTLALDNKEITVGEFLMKMSESTSFPNIGKLCI